MKENRNQASEPLFDYEAWENGVDLKGQKHKSHKRGLRRCRTENKQNARVRRLLPWDDEETAKNIIRKSRKRHPENIYKHHEKKTVRRYDTMETYSEKGYYRKIYPLRLMLIDG